MEARPVLALPDLLVAHAEVGAELPVAAHHARAQQQLEHAAIAQGLAGVRGDPADRLHRARRDHGGIHRPQRRKGSAVEHHHVERLAVPGDRAALDAQPRGRAHRSLLGRIDLGGGEARLEVAPAPAELAQLGRGRVLVIEGVGGPALPLAEAVGIAQPAGTAEREQGQRHQPGSGPLGPGPAQQLAFSSQVATNEALSTWSKMQSHESQEANETAP